MKTQLNLMKSIIKQLIVETHKNTMTEGIYDPGILKCIFLAGGPGSGKSHIANIIFAVDKNIIGAISPHGLKMVNSDTAFENGLHKNGINPRDLAKISDENPELFNKITIGPDSIRTKAKNITNLRKYFYEEGRIGMIIDGTGSDYEHLMKQKEQAEKLGYDCYMVFVNTSLDVALQRNHNRSRTLPDDLIKTMWNHCQENLGHFQTLFGGSNISIIDNTSYKSIPSQIQKNVDKFIREPVKNKIGKKWIQMALKLKKTQ